MSIHESILAVGGPYDGKVIAVADGQKALRVPILRETARTLVADAADLTGTRPQIFEYAVAIFSAEGGERRLFKPSGWSSLQLRDALIENYRPEMP